MFDKIGVLSTTLEGSLENWASFCEDLYSGHNIPQFSNTYCDNTELDQQVTATEFENAIKGLKNNKTPGIDLLRNEDLRLLVQEREDKELLLGCKTTLTIFFSIINSFMEKRKKSTGLKNLCFNTFLKDKNAGEHDPRNYRPISLLNALF